MRLGWLVAGTALVALTTPGVAGAHVRIGTLAVDVRVRLISPRPTAHDGFAVSVSDDRALHLTPRTGHRVVVVGYLGEPVLRVDARGVSVNLGSPTAAAAGLVAKGDEQRGARPAWLLRPGERTAVWRDPRLQRLPGGARRAVWAVPILVDGHAARIVGELRRASAPSLWRWLLVALAAGSLGGLGAIGRRRNRVRTFCIALGCVAVVAGVAAAAGFAFDAQASGMRVAVVYELVLAAGGAGFAVWGPAEVRVAAAGWLGLLGLIGGLACTQVFLHGDVLSVLPATVTRAAAALAIGSGAAASLLAAVFYILLPNLASPAS